MMAVGFSYSLHSETLVLPVRKLHPCRHIILYAVVLFSVVCLCDNC